MVIKYQIKLNIGYDSLETNQIVMQEFKEIFPCHFRSTFTSVDACLSIIFYQKKKRLLTKKEFWSKDSYYCISINVSLRASPNKVNSLITKISYRTVPSTIWAVFSEFLIFCQRIYELLSQWISSKIFMWQTREIWTIFYEIIMW